MSAVLLGPASKATRADTAENGGAPKIHIQALQPDADLSQFKDPRYETHPAGSSRAVLAKNELPPPQVRDRLFVKAGLARAVAQWDAVDRDVLFMRARTLSVAQLRTHYPKLKSESLGKFKSLVTEECGS